MREAYTDRTYFIWLVPLHYIIHIDTNQLFFEVRCTNFKFQSSWQVSSNFPFTGYQKVEAISRWGKVWCCFGCLLWNYIFKSSHSNTSSEICLQGLPSRGFQSMDSSFRPKCRPEGLDFDAAVLPRTGTQLWRVVIGAWNLQEDRGVPADETCFCYCKKWLNNLPPNLEKLS